MSEEKDDFRRALRLVFVTAAVTAVVTTAANNWLPQLVRHFYRSWTAAGLLTVQVQDANVPISGVRLSVSRRIGGELLASGETDEDGLVELGLPGPDQMMVKASHRNGDIEHKYVRVLQIAELPFFHRIDKLEFYDNPLVGLAPSFIKSIRVVDRRSNEVDLEVRYNVAGGLSHFSSLWLGASPFPAERFPNHGYTPVELQPNGETAVITLTWDLSGEPAQAPEDVNIFLYEAGEEAIAVRSFALATER